MSEALKPCPCCDSNEVKIKHIVSVRGDVNDYFGSCKKCGTNMGCFKTEEEAIKAWNNRPSPWHTGTPIEVGRYLIVIPKVSIDVEKSVNFNNFDELSYELKIAEYRSGNSFEYSEKGFLNTHYTYSVDCDKTLWMFIDETNIRSQMIM